AFDAVVRQDIWQSLEALEVRWDACANLEELHEGMCYLFRDVTTHVPVDRIGVKQGVRQGGVESPGLFVAVYDGIVYRIMDQLQQQEYPAIKVYFDPALKNIRCNDSLKEDECGALDVSQLKFFDDLLTFADIEECDAASTILEVLTGETKAGRVSVNGRKTEILLAQSGVGSEKRWKHIRAQTNGIVTWEDDDYFPLRPQPTVKYLGVQLAATGARHVEVANRIRAANSTHAQLLRRAFKSGFSAKLKVAHLARRELNKLESWQVKKLRGSLNSPAHLYKKTNREIRKRARTPTVTSALLLRRLRWWRQVLRPAFREPGDDLHDLRAVIFGRFSFEQAGHGGQSGTLTLLLDDMRQMWQTADAQEKLTARRLFQLHGDLPELAEPWLR
ncbi:unnamed protein product, partial [Prorocentrum cordatum]